MPKVTVKWLRELSIVVKGLEITYKNSQKSLLHGVVPESLHRTTAVYEVSDSIELLHTQSCCRCFFFLSFFYTAQPDTKAPDAQQPCHLQKWLSKEKRWSSPSALSGDSKSQLAGSAVFLWLSRCRQQGDWNVFPAVCFSSLLLTRNWRCLGITIQGDQYRAELTLKGALPPW